MQCHDVIYDLLGVGFGPANLALAVRLDEDARNQTNGKTLTSCFIERQARFGWHRGMLLEDSLMQMPFLKDVITMRDPRNSFTFVNYLVRKNRLANFLNQQRLHATRIEYHLYLEWVADAFSGMTHYGETVTTILPVLPDTKAKTVDALRVVSHDIQGHEKSRISRAVSIAIGGLASIPDVFKKIGSSAVFHSSRYLLSIDDVLQNIPRNAPAHVAVVGAGQSAVEIFLDLSRRLPKVYVTLIMRTPTFKLANENPFTNEIFSPGATDTFHAHSAQTRASLLLRDSDTNYGVADRRLVDEIYALLYRQNVKAEGRRPRDHEQSSEQRPPRDNPPGHQIFGGQFIQHAQQEHDGKIALTMTDHPSGKTATCRFDAVVLATGYATGMYADLLKPVQDYLGESASSWQIQRDYSLRTADTFTPKIFVQGEAESSHGLSETLLSLIPFRAHDIAVAANPVCRND